MCKKRLKRFPPSNYEIELKYDCLIDIIVFGKNALSDRLSYTPVYVRAMEEGVAI